MGNKPTTFKNFHLPNTSLNQSNSQFKIICGQKQKYINLPIDPKLKYKTINFKTQNYIPNDLSFQLPHKKSIKILTYNIWFQQHNLQNRFQAIFKIISQADADIICLQQVTQDFSQAFWKHNKQLCAKGQLFMPVIPMHWYDTLIVTKFPMTFYQIPFKQSSMARKLLMGVFNIVNDKNQVISFSINCVHLQSLDNQQMRKSQLQQISQINKSIDIVCLVGDLNFADNWAQDKIIQSEYIDIWNNYQSQNAIRWTMPKTQQFIEWRPDHVLIKNNKIGNQEFKKSLKAKIQRIGDFTIPPFQNQKVQNIVQDRIVRTPSDHMGLVANISF